MRGGRIGVAVVAAVMAAGLAVGCGSSAATAQPSVLVTPAMSLGDQPLTIAVHGAHQGQPVSVALSTTDGAGVRWSDQATFTAGPGGTVDLSTTAPTDGAYQGVHPDGLLDSLAPSNPSTPYFILSGTRPLTYTVSVSGPHLRSATASVTRRLPAGGVTMTTESLAATGFVGVLYNPAPGTVRHPAVLIFGGSEGGLSGAVDGAALASAGYPVLDLAYFGEPGLPATLTDIPLSYFASALTWFGRQPGVDPSQIWLLSGSRGTEPEFLLADHYPQLVGGLIALSASNVAHASFPSGTAPSWTYDGHPVPTDFSNFGRTAPAPDPTATIPVGAFSGPVFLACGTADDIWASCTYEQSEMSELAASSDPSARCWHQYTGGGHFVDLLVPYVPTVITPAEDDGVGDSPLADDDATAQEWPSILSFLAHPTSCGDPVTSGA